MLPLSQKKFFSVESYPIFFFFFCLIIITDDAEKSNENNSICVGESIYELFSLIVPDLSFKIFSIDFAIFCLLKIWNFMKNYVQIKYVDINFVNSLKILHKSEKKNLNNFIPNILQLSPDGGTVTVAYTRFLTFLSRKCQPFD